MIFGIEMLEVTSPRNPRLKGNQNLRCLALGKEGQVVPSRYPYWLVFERLAGKKLTVFQGMDIACTAG